MNKTRTNVGSDNLSDEDRALMDQSLKDWAENGDGHPVLAYKVGPFLYLTESSARGMSATTGLPVIELVALGHFIEFGR